MLKVYAMARTSALDPITKYRYRVSIAGIPTAVGFTKVSGIKRDIGVIEYAEGGYKHIHKLPGREKVEPITFERGMYSGDKSLYNLFLKTLTQSNFRQTVTIELLDKAGTKVERSWKIAEAWVKEWEVDEFDANSDEVAIEKIVIEGEYYED